MECAAKRLSANVAMKAIASAMKAIATAMKRILLLVLQNSSFPSAANEPFSLCCKTTRHDY